MDECSLTHIISFCWRLAEVGRDVLCAEALLAEWLCAVNTARYATIVWYITLAHPIVLHISCSYLNISQLSVSLSLLNGNNIERFIFLLCLSENLQQLLNINVIDNTNWLDALPQSLSMPAPTMQFSHNAFLFLAWPQCLHQLRFLGVALLPASRLKDTQLSVNFLWLQALQLYVSTAMMWCTLLHLLSVTELMLNIVDDYGNGSVLNATASTQPSLHALNVSFWYSLGVPAH